MFDFGNYDSGLYVLLGIFAVVIIALIFFVIIHKKYSKKKSIEKEFLQTQKNAALKDLGFNPTFRFQLLQVDPQSRQWNTTAMSTTYTFDDIEDCSIIEDGVAYKSDNGVIRAVVGGALFGQVGAVVGALTASSSEYVNSVEVWIYTKSGFHHTSPLKIVVSHEKIQKNSAKYAIVKKNAERIINILSNDADNTNNVIISNTADSLEKYKKLFDEGAITQDEYNSIKAKLISKI